MIRQRLLTYIDHVRKFEWPAMARGKAGDDAGRDLDQLSSAVSQVRPKNLEDLALYQHALRLLTVIADNRGERLDSADGSVPILLWFVLIVGGIITLSYPAFFGATNRLAQTLMTATLAALVALALLLALAMDYPFAGDDKISVQPFDEALDQMPPSLPTH